MAVDNLKGGRSDPVGFADSMAAAIEDELNRLLADDGMAELPPDNGSDAARQAAADRRRFMAAIARGVIRHLLDHPDALEVVFTHVPAPHAIGDFEAHVRVHALDVS